MPEGEYSQPVLPSSPPSASSLTPIVPVLDELRPSDNLLSESFTVTDTTNGFRFNFYKIWRQPATFVRLTLDQSSVVKYRLQKNGNWLTYAGGLSANIPLLLSNTVFDIWVIPSSSATLNIYASSGSSSIEED